MVDLPRLSKLQVQIMDLLLKKPVEGMYGAQIIDEGMAEGSTYTTLARQPQREQRAHDDDAHVAHRAALPNSSTRLVPPLYLLDRPCDIKGVPSHDAFDTRYELA